MGWFDFLNPKPGTGGLVDSRPPEAKANDIKFSEIVASTAPVEWIEKSQNMWRSFPERNQGQGNSCMANAGAKVFGVAYQLRRDRFATFSAADIYRRRFNKPGEGMILSDVFSIAKQGVTLEVLMPSEKLTDAAIDSLKSYPEQEDVGKAFAFKDEPIYIDSGDFDTVASVIQKTGKAVLGMFYFTYAEWAKATPTIDDPTLRVFDQRALRHGVAIVDAFKYNGVEYLLIEDSAHFGGLTKRLITRQFFTQRNFGLAYPMQFKFEQGTVMPRFTGTIMSAQECLRWEGFFPTNVSFVESVGPVTRAALVKFQTKYGILPATGDFGPKTKAKLTQIFP